MAGWSFGLVQVVLYKVPIIHAQNNFRGVGSLNIFSLLLKNMSGDCRIIRIVRSRVFRLKESNN